MSNKQIYVIGGGTFYHIRPHLALAAPAYGTAARHLAELILDSDDSHELYVYQTTMAGGEHMHFNAGEDSNNFPEQDTWPPHPRLETNEDVGKLIDEIVANPNAKILFLPVALCDFIGGVWGAIGGVLPSGKHEKRLSSKDPLTLSLVSAEKIIKRVRKERKDIFLVGFKTTTDATIEEQFEAGLSLLKTSSCNLVLANDLHTRMNMIITPEQAKYAVTTDRLEALDRLVEMTLSRAEGAFTRSTVVPGDPIGWDSVLVPKALRTVVNHCIKRGAYRPFLGATVGHFAVKMNETTFLTSRRKTNFNELDKVGLVKVETKGVDEVIAYGSKPSVGGQSQRIIFAEHPDVDCIAHFHCPLKKEFQNYKIPVREQWKNECGSHACGENTSQGLLKFGEGKNAVWAVMLDKHGPNIVFNKEIDPQIVIDFIETHFDLTKQTSEA